MEIPNRRPLKTRSAEWPLRVARRVAGLGLTPNAVSMIGVGFSLGGGCFFAASAGAWTPPVHAMLLVSAALCIQARLLCNMLDGLIAVECGVKSKVGDLFNEVPDRLEDTAFFLGAGYSVGQTMGSTLGWLAALLAVGAAYVRVLGGSLGFPQDFSGPGAKQHRMFLLTIAAIGAAIEADITGGDRVLTMALGLIVLLTAVTIGRRLVRLARALRAR